MNDILNELLVELFRDINEMEERAIQTEEFKGITTNDVHVIDAIGIEQAKNMSTVAKTLKVTMGTLTISVNSLVKKGYVLRERSEEDRRVVLISLTDFGEKAFYHHKAFHDKLIQAVVTDLDTQEKEVLEKALKQLNIFFKKI